jgi:O-antigen ligase
MAPPRGSEKLNTNVVEKPLWSFRLALVCFAAVSVSLPIAWISLSKVLLVVAGLGYLISDHFRHRKDVIFERSLTSKTLIFTVIAFFASLLWTSSTMDIALLALVKHAKLLIVLLLIRIIRTPREAWLGVLAFAAGQTFLLLSSWLLTVGVMLPWVTDPTGKYVVFSTYLDQSIMLASAAALFWHMRHELVWPTWLAGILSLAAMANVILLLEGRTGYAVAIAILSLAVMWTMPMRLRLVTLLAAPIVALTALYWISGNVETRVTQVLEDSRKFSQRVETQSSSGWRLNAWQRSLQAVQESPWYGHGVGSWAITVKRLEGDKGPQIFGEANASNPHQEYLLWSVELGVGGALLFMAVMATMALDARHFKMGIQRTVWSFIAAMAVACLFNSALYDDLIGDYFCVVLGLLMAYGLRSSPAVNPLLASTLQPQRLKGAA